MKRITMVLAACLLSLPMTACKTVATNTPPAPGYSAPADQTAGQDLAALNGFVLQARDNYAASSAVIQAKEKTALNAFIKSVDLANAAYTAYHAGTGTLSAAQVKITLAQNNQTALVAAQGMK